MREELKDIMDEEAKCLEELLELLNLQHDYILKKDVFKLEAIIEDIEKCNKTVAKAEVKRRTITKGRAMSEVIKELHSETLEDSYINVKNILSSLTIQKDTNEMILKQGIAYTGKILNIINPNRPNTTYNSLGKIGK
ncbi:flagellar export chaperone FlgN [Clostridium algidicarnis]|uniref:flagellar export chaperone FlgN n=1 Tax=Clostridium algidicarnis TaxID=37659 RepID=UPI001C0DA73C|nr:flagellar export chaperone FlgN [Clostridium algidicarnis]MBU3195846.1 flagellar protein FlgN [Clostridium algidicarnis]MBU3208872.1 flagellar protein FlgN [Clostridium algidicarnis]MBU3226618.1 flagellar protein FlgN [Clostridium algidicarnis]MBU3250471.1 flagellar protein FlgN [Clostridium algidicarnis]